SDNDKIAWFTTNPPVSGYGKWHYAQALESQHLHKDQISPLVTEAWRDADLTEDEEEAFLAMFKNRLSDDDHIARADRLVWDGKTTAALRMIPRLPVNYQVLMRARMALQKDEKNANFLLKEVSRKLENDSGLLFDRMQYRLRKKDKNGVRDIL